MAQQRDRVIQLQVDTIKIVGVTRPGLRVVAKAERTLKPEPNKCEVQIYNLTPEHRNALTKIKTPTVSLAAGYKDQITQIFLGQALHVGHAKNKAGDIITTVSTTDGGSKLQGARAKANFPKGIKAGDVLRVLAKALGIKAGNLEDAVRKINAGKAASIYAEGVCLSGHAPLDMTALCRSAGLEWSVQDGQLQILDVGRSSSVRAIVLDESQLLDTPSISNKNVVEGSCLIQKDFTPGRQVQIAHEFVSGVFRLEKCTYALDTWSDDWTVSFEAKGPPPK
jgi:hypothetical protein